MKHFVFLLFNRSLSKSFILLSAQSKQKYNRILISIFKLCHTSCGRYFKAFSFYRVKEVIRSIAICNCVAQSKKLLSKLKESCRRMAGWAWEGVSVKRCDTLVNFADDSKNNKCTLRFGLLGNVPLKRHATTRREAYEMQI